MATGKRYYWMKLKDSFMTSETVDFLMSQPNGANYVVLYQMLCLKTINTEGRFERQIGALLIPYDIEKIQRDAKWFSIDTIRIALNLYMQLELIYTDENGVMVIANHNELVGSETDYAAKNRRIRQSQKEARQLPAGDSSGHIVSSDVSDDVTTENRDKREDIRDKSLDTRVQILDSNFSDDDMDDEDAATGIVEEFANRNGLTMEAFNLLHNCDAKTRQRVAKVANTLFAKAAGSTPTEMDEAKVYSWIVESGKVSNDKIYILTCAFYKAADAGHRGQWNYIEGILSDMVAKGVRTKEQATEYFYARKDDF